MNEYLAFRKMITPVFIQVIFWIVVAVIVIVALVQLASGAAVEGIVLLVLGPLGARVYAEILMVIFLINDNVAALRSARTGTAASTELT